MPTISTAVRALRPGDVILEPLPSPVGGAAAFVVLDLAIADPGPVGLQLGRLGPIPPHINRVATVSWPADTVLEVVRPRHVLPVTDPARPNLSHRNHVGAGLRLAESLAGVLPRA